MSRSSPRFHLFVAAAATYKVTKKWIWVIGGFEYCVFWALCLRRARHADLAQITFGRRLTLANAIERQEIAEVEYQVIKAAIVGLGWWGKTLVEVGREQRRDPFRRRRDAHGDAGGRGLRQAKGLRARAELRGDARRSARSMRWCWRRRIPCTARR